MLKFKNKLKSLTDGIGIIFDPNDDEDEYEDRYEDDESAELEEKNDNSKVSIIEDNTPRKEITENIKNEEELSMQEDCRIIFISPVEFAECKKIADLIKINKVVTINLEKINPKDAQRMLDFLTGASNIKEAKLITISKNVYTSIPKGTKFTI